MLKVGVELAGPPSAPRVMCLAVSKLEMASW